MVLITIITKFQFMLQVEVIKVGGCSIHYLDFSDLRKKEEIFNQLEIYGKYIRRQPYNSLLTITNLNGMHFNTEIYSAFAAYVKANDPFVRYSGVVGMKGLMQIFYKGFVRITGRNIKVCESKEEAIAFLANTSLLIVA